jgi:negative elongation factor C/D
VFLSDLLLNSLFKPGYTPHSDHKHKYVYLLAYAASVHEIWGEVNIISIRKKKHISMYKQTKNISHLCVSRVPGNL